jgi:glucosamine-6-phosphate deaminase
MRFIIGKSKKEIGDKAGEAILDLVKVNPSAVLGLATGSSPLEIYDRLARGYQEGVSFAKVKSFNLDEYIACPIKSETYRSFMESNLFSKIDIDRANTNFPDDKDPSSYDKKIEEAGGVDLQVLGIGRNGHIGFNEPFTPRDSSTHIIPLTQSTREANARFFMNDIDMVPTKAVSMGLATIMKAKKILLIANDISKAEPIAALLRGEDNLSCPASVLLSHPDCDIYLTEDVYEAAKSLNERA